MIKVFETGYFRKYGKVDIEKAYIPITESVKCFSETKTSVFISHKHNELDEISNVISFLEKEYHVKAYIDGKDASKPSVTSGETAINLKNRIKECNKFILLATNEAIESKWCNWELGYGDANKFPKDIAILPIKPRKIEYKGNEYLEIYPHILYYDGTEKYYGTEKLVKIGYYVGRRKTNGHLLIQSLESWLMK